MQKLKNKKMDIVLTNYQDGTLSITYTTDINDYSVGVSQRGSLKELLIDSNVAESKILHNFQSVVNRKNNKQITHAILQNSDRCIHQEIDWNGENLLYNFMQGQDYDYFTTYDFGWCNGDKGLSDFIDDMSLYDFKDIRSQMSRIGFADKMMWVYHSAKVCYEDNSFITKSNSNKNQKAYYLFGDGAVEILEDKGIDALIEAYEDNQVGCLTYCYDQSKDTPTDLLYKAQGMNDFALITEEEYNKLNQ